MIGRSTPNWAESNEEDDQATELEALADGSLPTLLFMCFMSGSFQNPPS